ncbi:hypothetical protein JCM10207_003491 [Rhodosporidiobolus poonsookiae]
MTTGDEAFAKGYADLCLAFKTSQYGGGAERRKRRRRERAAAVHTGEESFALEDDDASMFSDHDDDGEDDEATSLMDAVDLLGGGTRLNPPKELMVEIRVLKDVGEVELLSGNRINLVQGRQTFLHREDVEAMVVLGEVEIVE